MKVKQQTQSMIINHMIFQRYQMFFPLNDCYTYYKCAKGASRNYESVIFGIFYLINSIRGCLHGAFSSLGRKVRLIFTVKGNPK